MPVKKCDNERFIVGTYTGGSYPEVIDIYPGNSPEEAVQTAIDDGAIYVEVDNPPTVFALPIDNLPTYTLEATFKLVPVDR